MVNMPRKEKLSKNLRANRPIRDNSYEARRALASVERSALKPEHLPLAEQIELYERQGNKLAAKMLRDRAAEQARRKSPTEQVPLNLETSQKPETRPQQETLNLPTEVVVKGKEEKLIRSLTKKTLAEMRPPAQGQRKNWIPVEVAARAVVYRDNSSRGPSENERLVKLIVERAGLYPLSGSDVK